MAITGRQIWFDALWQLAKRDGAVDICAIDPDDPSHVRPTFRARVLSVEPDGQVVVEKPDRPAAMGEFPIHGRVEILLIHHQQRWVGDCTIEQVRPFQLNEQKRLLSLILSRPGRVRSNQRRRFYRVNTAGAELSPIRLRPVFPEPIASMPIDDHASEQVVALMHGSASLEACVVNVSGGGVGATMIMDRQLLTLLKQCREFDAQLQLPHLDDPIKARAKLVHIRPMDNQLVYLGLQFEFDDVADQREAEDNLMHYGAKVQRDQLRRRTGA